MPEHRAAGDAGWSRAGPVADNTTDGKRPVKRGRTSSGQEASMERADWLAEGFDPAQARFLMLTAITHHRFTSRAWGEHEIRKLYAELTDIDVSAARMLESWRDPVAWIRRPALRAWWWEAQEA
jgi:hypothetical protein